MARTSVSTVSRVLTKSGPVAEETRRRVVEAISELGYQPNALARGLVQKRTGTIGVVVPDVANPFYGEVLRGMGDVASSQGYQLLLMNADLSFEKEQASFTLLREQKVGGMIYASGIVTPQHREIFLKVGRPIVLAATYDPDYPFPAVLVDSERGARLAMEHLIALGHRKVAVITGPRTDTIAGLPRLRGYLEGARQAGVTLDPEWMAEGDYRFESGYMIMNRFLNLGDTPTAVAAASDLMAFGAMAAIFDRGLRVPDDISVIGFDNLSIAEGVRPALTTIAQPMYDIGARAMTTLLRCINEQADHRVVWIEPALVVRQSTVTAADCHPTR